MQNNNFPRTHSILRNVKIALGAERVSSRVFICVPVLACGRNSRREMGAGCGVWKVCTGGRVVNGSRL